MRRNNDCSLVRNISSSPLVLCLNFKAFEINAIGNVILRSKNVFEMRTNEMFTVNLVKKYYINTMISIGW